MTANTELSCRISKIEQLLPRNGPSLCCTMMYNTGLTSLTRSQSCIQLGVPRRWRWVWPAGIPLRGLIRHFAHMHTWLTSLGIDELCSQSVLLCYAGNASKILLLYIVCNTHAKLCSSCARQILLNAIIEYLCELILHCKNKGGQSPPTCLCQHTNCPFGVLWETTWWALLHG